MGELSNEGLFIHRIKPLTVINIDTRINQQVGLTKNMPLQIVIDAYHDYIRINPDIKFNTYAEAQQYLMNRMIPFSIFINNLFFQKGLRELPPLLDLVAPALFK